MSDLKLDVDQAGELKAAFRRNGWTNADIKKLCEGNILAQVLAVLNDFAKIEFAKHILRLVHPFDPTKALWRGWTVCNNECDQRESTLTKINLADLLLENVTEEKETSITGREKLTRLRKFGKVLLGGRSFVALWAEHQKDPKKCLLERLYRLYGVTNIDLMGLILVGDKPNNGDQFFLSFRRYNDDNRSYWSWDARRLNDQCETGSVSLCM